MILVLYVEFWYLNEAFDKLNSTIEFSICYIVYLQIILSTINKWYVKITIFIIMAEYVSMRGEKISLRPFLMMCYILYSAIIYFEEKSARNKYYDIYKEIKNNENFKNLFKNIIPCGIFICRKSNHSAKLEIQFSNNKCSEDLDIQNENQII